MANPSRGGDAKPRDWETSQPGYRTQEVHIMRAGTAIASGMRHVVGVGLQALLIVAIVAGLAFAAATVVGKAPGGADSVFAAKGGNGHGHGGGAASTAAWLSVTPHSAAVGETFVITGGGFDPSVTTYILVKKPSSTTFFYASVDGDGGLFATSEVWETGRTLVEAYELSANGASQLVATSDVEVY